MSYDFGDADVTRYLTKPEAWLYRYCGTESVSGVSGPSVSVQDLLRTVAQLRHRMEQARGKITMIDASPAGSFNAQLKREAVALTKGPDYER